MTLPNRFWMRENPEGNPCVKSGPLAAAPYVECVRVDSLPGWRDIETAPKDGRVILLLTQAGNVYSPCQWENGEISEDGFWLWWQDEPAWLTEIANPTHWMPLPEPPEQTKGQSFPA